MTGPSKPVDLDHVNDVHDALYRILRDRRTFQKELAQKDEQIARLKEKVRVAEEWQGRLHEKCMTLEAIPGGVLDAWDEQFLFDHDSVLYFKRLAGGRRRLVMERRGMPRLVKNGAKGDVFLRDMVEAASGRKRASP